VFEHFLAFSGSTELAEVLQPSAFLVSRLALEQRGQVPAQNLLRLAHQVRKPALRKPDSTVTGPEPVEGQVRKPAPRKANSTENSEEPAPPHLCCCSPKTCDYYSLPSHRNIEKMVGNFMKACHKAGDEKHKTSNRVKIDGCPSALQLYSQPLSTQAWRGRLEWIKRLARLMSGVTSSRLCYAQVTHSIGLNDVCDALQLNSGPLSALRGRDAAHAEQFLARQ
jgi:hypothetical protein